MRRGPIAVIAAVLIAAVVVAVLLVTRAPEAATPSPSPTAASSPTVTSSPTAAPATATPTSSPSPTPQGAAYMSKRHGFALQLPPPWRKAICGNIDIEPSGDRQAIEAFTGLDPATESIGHIGSTDHRVAVAVLDNPRNLSPMEFTSGQNPIGSGANFGTPGVRSVTFAGRAAAEFGDPGGTNYGYIVGDGSRMYLVYYVTLRFEPAPEPAAAMTRIVRSFRFLSASDRQALPDPTPIPAAAPTAQALAASLKTAFEQKDVAALERLLSPCVNSGARNGGVDAMSRQRYVAQLRQQFAAGLVVTVDTGQVRLDERGSGDTLVRSRWNAFPAGAAAAPPSPGGQSFEVELILSQTTGGFYWRGTLVARTP